MARKNYTKDIQALRGRVDILNGQLDAYQKSCKIPQPYDHIQVKYFESLDFVCDSDVLPLINEKIRDIKQKYDHSLTQMQEYNDKLLNQIALFRKLETMENIGITFDEMKCESVIMKLAAIE